MRFSGFWVAACWLIATSMALADAPRVARSTIEDGAMAVDPATTELRVTFDRDMSRNGYSFVGGGPTFPGDPSARPRWLDARTAVLPLRLEPGREYQLNVNSERFRNFRATNGEPAVPCPIRFRTAPVDREARAKDLTEFDNHRAVEALRKAIDERYSYRDLHGVDWDSAFRQAEATLLTSRTPLEFAKRAAVMLGPARDMHLWLGVGSWQVPTFERRIKANFDPAAVDAAIPGLERQGPIASGLTHDGIAYLRIETWESGIKARLDAVDQVIDRADPDKGLILDVRPNGGGAEPLALRVAGRFLDAPRVYARHVTREAAAFSEVRDRVASPRRDQARFTGRVVVLTGPGVMSSCEAFLMMMKQVPNCTLVGGRSYGSSGNPKPVDLGNGVIIQVPSWKSLKLDGTGLEGEGIEPDVTVDVGPRGFADGDPILKAALAILRRK